MQVFGYMVSDVLNLCKKHRCLIWLTIIVLLTCIMHDSKDYRFDLCMPSRCKPNPNLHVIQRFQNLDWD